MFGITIQMLYLYNIKQIKLTTMSNLKIVFLFLLGLLFINIHLSGVGVFCIIVSLLFGLSKLIKNLRQ